VVGAITGFFNGILIAQIKMPPFIATLGSMSIARGLGLMMSNGSTTVGLPNVIGFLGSGRIGFIYTPIVLMLILYGVFWWILRYTKFGRNIYAIGGNMEAAKLSGIKVKKTLLGVYVLSGICASIAAIVLIGRLNSASPTAGKSYEMDAIAATVIGGTSMNGGEGKIIGTLVGALFIAVLRNGLNLLNVSSYSTEIFVGVLIVVAVMMDTIRQSKNA
jgi:ribose transport system permease protein